MLEVMLENNRWIIYKDGKKLPYSTERIVEMWK